MRWDTFIEISSLIISSWTIEVILSSPIWVCAKKSTRSFCLVWTMGSLALLRLRPRTLQTRTWIFFNCLWCSCEKKNLPNIYITQRPRNSAPRLKPGSRHNRKVCLLKRKKRVFFHAGSFYHPLTTCHDIENFKISLLHPLLGRQIILLPKFSCKTVIALTVIGGLWGSSCLSVYLRSRRLTLKTKTRCECVATLSTGREP